MTALRARSALVLGSFLALGAAPAVLASIACVPFGIGSFSVLHDIPEQQVEGNLLGGLLGSVLGIPIVLDIDLEAETASRETGPAQHVFLTDFRLEITPTAEGGLDRDDFDFLQSIEVFVESSESGSSLPRERIAFREAVPRGARSIELDVEDLDVIDYVREGARLTASANGSAPLDDVTFDGQLTLLVEVLPSR